MVSQILSCYPTYPLKEVEGTHNIFRRIFRGELPVWDPRYIPAAARFVLANRIVKMYNKDFANSLDILRQKFSKEYSIDREALPAFFTRQGPTSIILRYALSIPLKSMTDSCEEYLRTIPRNSFSPKVEQAIRRIQSISSKLTEDDPNIAEDLVALQDDIKL
jgi:hypothetical protein